MLLAKLIRDHRVAASVNHQSTHVSGVISFLITHANDESNAWMSVAGAGYHITVDLYGSGPVFVEIHGPYSTGSELDQSQFNAVSHHCGTIAVPQLAVAFDLMDKGQTPFDTIAASSQDFRSYNGYHDD